MLTRTALAAALAAACSPALAGGLAPTAAAPAPVAAPVAGPAATRDWTGFYAGLQVGTGAFESTIDFPSFDRPEDYLDGTGTLAGLHLGYMRDLGRVVVGAELDYDTADVGLAASSDWYFDEGQAVTTVDSIARAKLRLGYDAGRVLPYVTAGIAEMSLTAAEPWIGEFVEERASGRFVGLGAVYAVNDRLTVGLEALRHHFDGPGNSDADVAPVIDATFDTVSLRASWRF